MKTKKTFPLLAASLSVAAVLSGGLISPATASVLLSDSFESYALGITPANPGDGDPHDWVFNHTLTADIIAGAAPGGIAPNEKVLHISKNNTGGYTPFGRQFERQDAATTEIVKLSFALQVNTTDESSYYIQLVDGADLISGSNFAPISLRISNGAVGVEYRQDGAGEGAYLTAWNPQGGNLRVGDWYQFEITANLLTQTYGASVLNLTDGSQSGSVDNLFFMTDTNAVNGLLFRSLGIDEGQDLAIDWNLNDVSVVAVPEPKAVTMALGSVLLLFGSQAALRRRKAAAGLA